MAKNLLLLPAFLIVNLTAIQSSAELLCKHVAVAPSVLMSDISNFSTRILEKGLVSLSDQERTDLHSMFQALSLNPNSNDLRYQSWMSPTANHQLIPPQAGLKFPSAQRWRKNLTNAETDVTYMDPESEKNLRALVKSLNAAIVTDRNAAESDVEFIGVGKVKNIINRGDYGTHISPRYEVSKLDASGKIRLVMAFTTSGHDVRTGDTMTEEQLKIEELKRQARVFGWSLNDKYSVQITDLNNNLISQPVTNAPSRDITTIQELDVTLKPNEVVRVKYQRGGSAGADAYAEARIIEIVWDGSIKGRRASTP